MASIKVRKKSEVKEILEERIQRSAEKREARDTWMNHWEREGTKVAKSLGGGKRPTKMKDLDLIQEREYSNNK
ncbi:MAG: hypothetical protein BM556_16550 [Bacteriovorax sp. MedPE-SWde]|nr:MAG: hypothetical protein BM556_16550 [Bacteriovorax sp. MedPE-SWde]